MKKMKKFAALFLSAALVTACVACGNDAGSSESGSSSTEESSSESSEESSEASDAESEESSEASGAESGESGEASDAGSEASGEASGEVMAYVDYAAAPVDSEVVIETYVQAKQYWWKDQNTGKEQATLYTQDKDGAYFVYNAECPEDDYAKLTPGTKIKVTGFKADFEGEVEIMDATFEIVEGGDSYVAEPEDVTALLGKDELIDKQNKFVSFKGMTVEAAAEGSEEAFLYKWDGSGSEGDDLYFNASIDGQTYTFTVESDLCDNTTDVYAAVKNLKVGDKIDMEGFLYWYQGVNPHITSVTAAE